MWSWLIAGAASVALLGQPCPPLVGKTLAGQPIRLPQAVAGKPGLLVLGFRMGAKDDSAAWAQWAARAYAKSGRVQPYVVVVVEGPAFLAPLVEGAMRAGQDPRTFPYAVTLFDPAKQVRERLGVNDTRHATVLLLDQAGIVRWRTEQGFTPAAAATLTRVVEGLLK